MGTVLALVEERSGADPGDPPVIDRYLYTPYGEAAVAAEDIAYDSIAAASATLDGRFPGGQNCLFQGLWTDPVTGIAYARNRWYDGRNASWLSEDPKGAVDSPNLYAFVSWAPHLHTDPMGEEWPKWLRSFHSWLSGHASEASGHANAYVKAETDYIRKDLEQVEFWTANLVVRPFAGAAGGYRTSGEAAVGLAVLGFDVGVSSFSLGLAERFGSDRRLDLTADFLAHPIQGTKEHVGGMLTEIAEREARGDIFGASLVSGQVGGEVALTIEGGVGVFRLGRATVNRARSFRLFDFSRRPTEPYNRRLHYGDTPTRADRQALGAESGQVVDHDPPLVMRFFEGDPAVKENPGYLMTAEERLASARDRSRMRLQLKIYSDRQGAEMSRYSRAKKKEFDLGID
jgi:RHS repeat-associated protein